MNTSLLRILIEIANSDPKAIAVVDDHSSTNYEDLLTCILFNLTRIKRVMGNRSFKRIGIYMDASFDYVVSVFVARALNATFVPLDPLMPKNRLKLIVDDASIECIFLQNHRINIAESLQLPHFEVCSVSKDEGLSLESCVEPINNREVYVLYTSGSTGNPKGVVIGEAGLVHLVKSVASILKLGPSSRVLQLSRLMFDGSIFEILCTILNGATLCIPNSNDKSPMFLKATIQDYQISHIVLPPSMLAVLDNTGLDCLQCILSMGESCSQWVYEKWKNGPWMFVNGYGPTEATICTSLTEFSKQKYCANIGNTIPDVTMFVLDERDNHVEQGEIGQLFIAGPGLALRYLNDIEATERAFRFIPRSQLGYGSKEKGRNLKVYASGDKVRFLDENNIEYIGRVDFQMNINGIRIEPGEIESTINQFIGVRESIVQLLSARNQKILVAFVTENKAVDSNSLLSFLRQYLPYYMVPHKIIVLQNFPLTCVGKIDREKLKDSLKSHLSLN